MSLSMLVFLAVVNLEATQCIPPFFLCLTVFYSSSTNLPLSRSMPGSEVPTTESLCCALMWSTAQIHSHTHQGQVKTNSTHTCALCLSLLCLKAQTAHEKQQGQGFAVQVSVLWCALMLATLAGLVSGTGRNTSVPHGNLWCAQECFKHNVFNSISNHSHDISLDYVIIIRYTQCKRKVQRTFKVSQYQLFSNGSSSVGSVLIALDKIILFLIGLIMLLHYVWSIPT